MARVGIVFGLLLCGLTVLGLVGSAVKLPMQFIPMMLGIPILFCGVVALNPHRRRHAMHAATAIGLLGAIFGSGRAVYCGVELASGEAINRFAWNLVIAMSIGCAVFVIICAVWLVQTRRRRLAGIPVAATGVIDWTGPAAKPTDNRKTTTSSHGA